MKHIMKFNENFRDDIKNQVISNISIPEEYKVYIDDVKNDMINFLDNLSDEEMETVAKIQKVRSGEMNFNELNEEDIKTLNKVQLGVIDIIGSYTKNN
jgi:uncharacterized protein YktB (UPF0637 family)